MNQRDDKRISQLSTFWTALRDAHSGNQAAKNAAQELLLERYGLPIRRYLTRLTDNRDASDELWQEFATRLIQGDFRGIDPSKGRFRSYLKTVLVRMALRQRQSSDRRATLELDQLPGEVPAEDDDSFDVDWREHLLARTWQALGDARPTYEQVLRLRTEMPSASSQALAEAMHDRHGVSWSAATLRQSLHRARERFGELLVNEVAHTVDPVTQEAVETELAALELLSYCKPWIDKWSAPV